MRDIINLVENPGSGKESISFIYDSNTDEMFQTIWHLNMSLELMLLRNPKSAIAIQNALGKERFDAIKRYVESSHTRWPGEIPEGMTLDQLNKLIKDAANSAGWIYGILIGWEWGPQKGTLSLYSKDEELTKAMSKCASHFDGVKRIRINGGKNVTLAEGLFSSQSPEDKVENTLAQWQQQSQEYQKEDGTLAFYQAKKFIEDSIDRLKNEFRFTTRTYREKVQMPDNKVIYRWKIVARDSAHNTLVVVVEQVLPDKVLITYSNSKESKKIKSSDPIQIKRHITRFAKYTWKLK